MSSLVRRIQKRIKANPGPHDRAALHLAKGRPVRKCPPRGSRRGKPGRNHISRRQA